MVSTEPSYVVVRNEGFRIKENLKHSNRFYEAYKNIKDMSLYYSPFHRFLNESHFLTNGCGVSKLKERIKESYEKGIREKIFERGYSFLCLITR